MKPLALSLLLKNVLVLTTFGSTYAFECDSVFNNSFGALCPVVQVSCP